MMEKGVYPAFFLLTPEFVFTFPPPQTGGYKNNPPISERGEDTM